MKKKVLLTSVGTIVLCLCLIAGSTYALFTDSVSVNVAVHAATLDIRATIDEKSLKLTSFDRPCTFGTEGATYFENGGTASVSGAGVLQLQRMTPGDAVKFKIKVRDLSNVHTLYRVNAQASGELINALKITATINGQEWPLEQFSANGKLFSTKWGHDLGQKDEDGCYTILVSIIFPNSAEHANQNRFQGDEGKITVTVEAVQGNGVDVSGNLITIR